MFFSWDDDLVEVTLEDEDGNKESVSHRRYVSRKDRTIAREAGMTTRILFSGDQLADKGEQEEAAQAPAENGKKPDGKGQPQVVSTFNMDAAQNAMLERMIVRWTFHYPNGDAVPVNKETIGQLRDTVSKKIVDSINEHNKPVEATADLEVISPPLSVPAGIDEEPSDV